MNIDNEMELMTMNQLVKFLNISRATLERMQRDGQVPLADYTITGANKRLWKREKIVNWLNTSCTNPKATASA